MTKSCEECGCECAGCVRGAETGDYSGCELNGKPECPCEHDWDADIDGMVFCQICGAQHPNNVPEWNTDSLQDKRPDLFDSRGCRRADY